MENWRKVWRVGVHPLLSVEQLEMLRDALVNDDPRMLQGATTTPPPLMCVQDWPVEAACLLGLCGVVEHGGFGTAVVADVEESFGRLCYNIDRTLGEPAGCRWLLNWFDDTPRDEMRRHLLQEVNRSIAEKTTELAK